MSRKRIVGMALVGFSAMSLFAGAGASAADDSGAYLGVGIGQANNKADEIDFDASDSAFKFFAGYAFNKYFATELAYVDAGSPEQTIAEGTVQIHSTGMIVSAVGQLPLGERFSLFGKLGYAFYDTEASLRAGTMSLSEKSSDDDLAYGIGVAFSLGKRFSLRAEYEAIDIPDGSFTMISAGAVFKF